MYRLFLGLFLGLCLLVLPVAQAAEGQWLSLATRADVSVPVFWYPQAEASATLVLLPGGAGGIGARQEDGWPGGRNFLIRSGPLFARHGFNLAMVSHPSDVADLDYAFRISPSHLRDLHAVLLQLKARSPAPIWLVGTSRGTVSAAAAAIAERDSGLIAGLVLTSSVTSYKKPGALPRQDLEQIGVPVLLLHHQRDACEVCQPYEVPRIFAGLTRAPVKKLLMVNGCSNPTGSACEALHWHGYIGMEAEAVDLIAAWVRQPAP